MFLSDSKLFYRAKCLSVDLHVEIYFKIKIFKKINSVFCGYGGCLDGVWRVSMGVPNGMWCVEIYLKGRSGMVTTRQVKSVQVKSGQV